MTTYRIVPETSDHAAAVDDLVARSFGAGRNRKTVYRLRERTVPLGHLCFVALDPDERVLAALRFYPVRAGETPAILLGPLAVEPAIRGQGVGRSLVRHGLDTARDAGEALCLVVGDPRYYAPYGFEAAVRHGLVLPGPVDPRRFQVAALQPGALARARGVVSADPARAGS